MQLLIWAVFLAGALTFRYFFGAQGRFWYFVAVLVVIGLFRKPLVIALTHVASKFGLIKDTINRMPTTITLERAPSADAAAKPVAAELAAAGFVDAGAWNIRELPKIRLALMVHPIENFFAAIETTSAIGAQVNIHTLYPNDRITTFTNSRLPAPRAQRPGAISVRVPGSTPAALLAKARAGRRREGIESIRVEDAPSIYERLYAEAIRFRKAQGA